MTMTDRPFIVTRGLREPLEEEVEPTPQEKFDHAMKLVQDYGTAVYATNSGDAAVNEAKAAKAHDALFNLFWDIYGLGRE
jgi:hypothetical protein